MKPNQLYFERNRGSWDWLVEFKLRSWSALWKADIPVFSKACLSVLTGLQGVPGPLRLRTNVAVSDDTVQHTTKMKKWGLTIYKSEKTFFLEDDGFGLRLTGKEYFWPLSFIGIPFAPTTGTVDSSTTRAFYQMPMAGTRCDCRTVLEPPVGYMTFESDWMKGRFTLTPASNQLLLRL